MTEPGDGMEDWCDEVASQMKQGARLLGIEPGGITLHRYPPLNDWTAFMTFGWCLHDPLCSGRVEVADEHHAPLHLVRNFMKTLGRVLRNSGTYEATAELVYNSTPPSTKEDDVWVVLGGDERHSRKNLLNDLILVAAENIMESADLCDEPIPTAGQALVAAIRAIDVTGLVKDLRNHRRCIGGGV